MTKTEYQSTSCFSAKTVTNNKSERRLAVREASRLRAVAEDSAFMVPAAAALSLAYKRIRCPTAIVAGLEDQIVKCEQAKQLKQALPHAAITSVPDSGHMLHYFVSKEIAQTADRVRLQAGLSPGNSAL